MTLRLAPIELDLDLLRVTAWVVVALSLGPRKRDLSHTRIEQDTASPYFYIGEVCADKIGVADTYEHDRLESYGGKVKVVDG